MNLLKKLLKGLLILLAFFVIVFYMVKFFHTPIGRAPEKSAMQSSDYYQDGEFINPVPTSSADFSQLPEILKSYWNRKAEKRPNSGYIFEETGKSKLEEDTTGSVFVNWLGHAALLLQKEGKYILTDPMLSKRASPFSFLGPKRYNPSPIPTEDLPELEAVIISHDHYDHLDYETIVKLKDKTKFFYVPLGVAASLVYWGVAPEKIKEFNWYDSFQQTDDLKITATPARHFSGRLFSRNNTFWASWVIKWGEENIYFGGDTGIFDRFAEIDEKFGPFDIAFMPVGAYNDAWHDIHMNPEEAVDAFRQMRADKLYPIHWGTFDLALHSWYEPIQKLTEMSEERNIPLTSTPQGQWFSLDESGFDLNWWRKYSTILNLK
ncbi:MBL fold metallo-hydrolase [Marivirga sp. S37H4]|uniref:MBL fold metallo-hydrolase n=1 Tax=Marivirga aurantiaca TaxID=2802615 RepID=A0A934WWY4_9BACT|nr:MBL fold metallo-hydrolase [Marivirga aurantiaca]MBK6264452.1 MBL fold metallo-hydrolase [Marivirga aurantiaca]